MADERRIEKFEQLAYSFQEISHQRFGNKGWPQMLYATKMNGTDSDF